MTLQEFYKYACIAAKFRGFNDPNKIDCFAVIYGGNVHYGINMWIANSKRIEGGLKNNPVSAIRSFKDAIDFNLKTYSEQTEDIEL